jgi:hypothetical protein
VLGVHLTTAAGSGAQSLAAPVTYGTDPSQGRAIVQLQNARLGDFAMDSDVIGSAGTDEDVLTFDVPDDALERAGSVSPGGAMTWVYCTQGWYNCGWPQ